jgi:hypothetical protein
MVAWVNREAVRRLLRRVAGWYRACALTLFNTAALFLLVNLALAAAFRVWGNPGGQEHLWEHIYWRHGEAVVAQGYPGLDKEDRDRLLRETWSRPYAYEPFTQFKEGRLAGKWVNVGGDGFRLTAGQGPWPPDPGKCNVFLFGGSTTFGYGVADGQTIPSHLQAFLRDRWGEGVRVYNCGRGSYYTTQERVLFEKLLLAGAVPAVAVFIDGLNEFLFLDDEPRLTRLLETSLEEANSPKARSFGLASQLPAARAIRGVRSRLGGPGQGPLPVDGAVTRVLERYHGNKRLAEAAARAYGVRPVFVWQPIPAYKYDLKYHLFAKDGDFKGLIATYAVPGYRAMAERVKERPADYSHNFLWLADVQEHAEAPLYVDMVHYSPDFSRELAAHIGRFLLERDQLPVRAP